MKASTKKILAGMVFALCASTAYAGELTVYTAIEAEDLARYAEAFNKENPDIKINWVRDSTGVVTPSCWPKRTTRRLTSCGAWPPPRF